MKHKRDKIIQFAALGDCCVDRYETQGTSFLGGTAFNAAVAARRAGARVQIISAIGNDESGQAFIASCKKAGIQTVCLQQIHGSTSSIHIRLLSDGSPSYGRWDLGALAKFSLDSKSKQQIAASDIAHAVLFKQLKNLFDDYCNMTLPHTLKSADFAGISVHSTGLQAVKAYSRTVDVIWKSAQIRDMKTLQSLRLLSRAENKLVIVLLGKDGSMAFYGQKQLRMPAQTARVVNMTGAGDAYCGTFLVLYKKTGSIEASMKEASRAAGLAVSQMGASLQIIHPMRIGVDRKV